MMQNCFTSQLNAATKANINAKYGWITVFFMSFVMLILAVTTQAWNFWTPSNLPVFFWGWGCSTGMCLVGALFWTMKSAHALNEMIKTNHHETSVIRLVKHDDIASIGLAVEWCQLLLVNHQNEVRINQWFVFWPWATPFLFH